MSGVCWALYLLVKGMTFLKQTVFLLSPLFYDVLNIEIADALYLPEKEK